MSELWQCQDRWGRTIRLTSRRWRHHILYEHAELTGAEGHVRDVVVNPAFVNYDRLFSYRENYYRRSPLAPPYHRCYLKVCVEFTRDPVSGVETGFVVTAHLRNKPNRGERRRWP